MRFLLFFCFRLFTFVSHNISNSMIDYKIGSKFFKECPECAGRVGFGSTAVIDGIERGENAYYCENFLINKEGQNISSLRDNHNLQTRDLTPLCNTYVRAHKQTTTKNKKDTPIGIMASLDLRNTHNAVREEFNPLWQDKIIHKIWSPYIVSYLDGKEDVYCERICSTDKHGVVLEVLDTNERVMVNPEMVSTVKTRTKAHLWLAREMTLTLEEAKISNMDIKTSIEAINVIRRSVRGLKKTA